MGKAIEKLAIEKGHKIAGIINVDNISDLNKFNSSDIDVAIEFTQPDVAVNNILCCLKSGIPVISGTTGWQDRFDEVKQTCEHYDGTFLYASNFSLGVNLFFKLNQVLAKLMDGHGYKVSLEETHHIHKKDAPSGTAITLAEGIINESNSLNGWTLSEENAEDIPIKAIRENEVPGTHVVRYTSEVDGMEIKHEAYSRQGFVNGAILVAEWISKQKGVLTMDDFLSSVVKL